jgi:hypothetical protein
MPEPADRMERKLQSLVSRSCQMRVNEMTEARLARMFAVNVA